MKTIISTILETLLKALGPSITTGGIVTESEWATISGAILTLVVTLIVVIQRNRANRAATAAFTGSVADKLRASATGQPLPVLLLALLIPAFAILPACTLTSAQKQALKTTASKVLVNVVKVGVQAGLNAIAANNPTYASYIAPLSASFQVTFAAVDDSTPPADLAARIRADVETTIADTDARRDVLAVLSTAIAGAGAGATSAEVSTGGDAAPPPPDYAAAVAALLK